MGTSLLLTEDSADLDSIEAVANEVLKMEMPSTPQQLQNLTEDIRERVESLSQVEVILQQSAADIARAELLLEEAQRARYLKNMAFRGLISCIWHGSKKACNQWKFSEWPTWNSLGHFKERFFLRGNTFFMNTSNTVSFFTQQKCDRC